MKLRILSLTALLLCPLLLLACSSIPPQGAATIDGGATASAIALTAKPQSADSASLPMQTAAPAASFEPHYEPAEETLSPDDDGSGNNVSAEPEATPHIEPEPTHDGPPSRTPIDSFSFADNDIVSVDLDYDGVVETVSIVPSAEAGIFDLIIEAEDRYSLSFDISSLVCAYVTDFCFGDGSAELLVSYISTKGKYVTAVIGSFTSDTPVSCTTIDGWVEVLSDKGVLICRTADIIGMRGISRLHTFDTEGAGFIPLDKEWTVYSYGQYARITEPIRIIVDGENGEESLELPEGTRLYPTATDLFSYIYIETEDGVIGRLDIGFSQDEGLTYMDAPLDSFFTELPQW